MGRSFMILALSALLAISASPVHAVTVPMASEIFVTNKVTQVSNYVDRVSDRLSGMEVAVSNRLADVETILSSNAVGRLVNAAGDLYQDATGVVWRLEEETVPSPWHVKDIYYRNDTHVETNEIPNVPSWSISLERGSEADEGGYYYDAYLHIPEDGDIVWTGDTGTPQPSEEFIYDVWCTYEFPDEIDRVHFQRTNMTVKAWKPVDRVCHEGAMGRRIAMFVLPVNDLGGNVSYNMVELKCSTNNYDTTEFYTNTSWPGDDQGDGSVVFITGNPAVTDKRKYWNITVGVPDQDRHTYIGSAKSMVILVDPSMCHRTDGGWLYEGNDDVAWVWARSANSSREEDGVGNIIWRPTAPVRWFSRMPAWAR